MVEGGKGASGRALIKVIRSGQAEDSHGSDRSEGGSHQEHASEGKNQAGEGTMPEPSFRDRLGSFQARLA